MLTFYIMVHLHEAKLLSSFKLTYCSSSVIAIIFHLIRTQNEMGFPIKTDPGMMVGKMACLVTRVKKLPTKKCS